MKIAILFFIAASALAAPVAPRVITETGTEAFHTFRSRTDGTLLTVPCTLAEYSALSLRGAVVPTRAGYTWVSSERGATYSSGQRPQDGDIISVSGGVVAIVSGTPVYISGASIAGGRIVGQPVHPDITIFPNGTMERRP